MSASDDSDIFIPSVFVGQTAGQIILYDYMYLNGESLAINRFEGSASHISFSFLRLRARAQRRFPVQHKHAPDNSVLHCCRSLLHYHGELIAVSPTGLSLICTFSRSASWLLGASVSAAESCATGFRQAPSKNSSRESSGRTRSTTLVQSA